MGKPPEGLETDHINRDKLDNRRENLRFVTHRENLLNRSSKSASGVKGVYFCSGRSKPWRAQITRYGKRVNIGYYKSIEEAAAAVKERAEC